MDRAIYEHGRQIGAIHAEQAGLFWEFSCKITADTEPLRRLYVIKGWHAEYLGIPDARGALTAHLPVRHLPEGFDLAVASRAPRGDWLPWRGVLADVEVEDAYLRHTAEGILLALPPEEALKFPAWADQMRSEELFGRAAASLLLGPDGQLPSIEKETGGEPNEELEEISCDPFAPDDGADAAADAGVGSDAEQGWEADRPDV